MNNEQVVLSERLERLEGYLREDPNNEALLADAFALGLRAHEWSRAEFHLRHALALKYSPLSWGLREGDFWLAQKRWEDALAVLEPMLFIPNAPDDFRQVLIHNLAFAEFSRGAFAECVARLEEVLEPFELSGKVGEQLQLLWLRALHRTSELERARQWAAGCESLGLLSAQVAGVASLIALDDGDFVEAQRWSESTSVLEASGAASMEALVTRSSLALAKRDPATARQFANTALKINPDDGRSWSALAFADMLAGDLVVAQEHFVRSLAHMPEHIGTWHGLGWAQILLHDYTSAKATFTSALEMDRNFSESHGGLAVVLAMTGNKEEAKAHVERALRLDPNGLSGRYAQALLSGALTNPQAFQKLSYRLLKGVKAPLGGEVTDWLPGREDAGSKEEFK